MRTAGEQRGVFLLASIPVLAYAMRRSSLFVRDGRGEAALGRQADGSGQENGNRLEKGGS